MKRAVALALAHGLALALVACEQRVSEEIRILELLDASIEAFDAGDAQACLAPLAQDLRDDAQGTLRAFFEDDVHERVDVAVETIELVLHPEDANGAKLSFEATFLERTPIGAYVARWRVAFSALLERRAEGWRVVEGSARTLEGEAPR